MTYREMMDRMGTILGKRHMILKVPVLTPTLSAYWVDFVTPVPASVAHALIEGLRNEVVVRDQSARRVLPIPLTPFDEAVRAPWRGNSKCIRNECQELRLRNTGLYTGRNKDRPTTRS